MYGVTIAGSGARLLQEDAFRALCSLLLPKARVITPNIPEAEALCGRRIGSVEEARAAAIEIGKRFDTACVVKGGHLPGESVSNVLFDAGEVFTFSHGRTKCAATHGTGCTFSAAIVSFLARGSGLSEAVERAGRFVAECVNQNPAVLRSLRRE